MTSLPAADAATQHAATVRPDFAIDVLAERARTLGAIESRHFNAAGAALPTTTVVAAVTDHLRLEERVGGYEAAAQMRDQVEAIYGAAATLVRCAPEEIALFDSASTGLRVLLDALRPRRGMRIIASSSTYVSHALHLMTLRDEEGVELVIAPTDAHRRVDLVALETLLSDGRPTIITVAHIPTSSGLVEPVSEIGRLSRRYGATYLLDATQSVGHLDIGVADIGCHMLVTTGRKFLRAPRGTAFAYVEREQVAKLTPTSPDVRGSQWTAPASWEVTPSARRFETWEAGIAGRLGLGVALQEAVGRGLADTSEWLAAAGGEIRRALAEIPGVQVAEPTASPSAIVTFVVDGMPSANVAAQLAERDVRVVSVPATHGQWDLGDRAIASVVRASPHVYNDEGDIAELLDGVAHIAREGARP